MTVGGVSAYSPQRGSDELQWALPRYARARATVGASPRPKAQRKLTFGDSPLVSTYVKGDPPSTPVKQISAPSILRTPPPKPVKKAKTAAPVHTAKPISRVSKETDSPATVKKKKYLRLFAWIPAFIAAFGKALKDGFGPMSLYSLIAIGALKLTPALINPWVIAGVVVLGVALFFISMGMEGKSLRMRILGFLSKRVGSDLTVDNTPLKPVNGKFKRFSFYLAAYLSKGLRKTAPWTAGICKGISGMGSIAGLLIIFGAGLSTAIGVGAFFGVTLGLVSRYKEGDDFIKEAKTFEASCWERLHLPSNHQEIEMTPQIAKPQRHFGTPKPVRKVQVVAEEEQFATPPPKEAVAASQFMSPSSPTSPGSFTPTRRRVRSPGMFTPVRGTPPKQPFSIDALLQRQDEVAEITRAPRKSFANKHTLFSPKSAQSTATGDSKQALHIFPPSMAVSA